MIKLRPFTDEKDQAQAIAEFLDENGRHIIETAPKIAAADHVMILDANQRLGRDFTQLSQLIGLTMNNQASALAHDLLSKVMIGSWMTGVAATFSPEAKRWTDAVKGQTANKGNIDKAAAKNKVMKSAVEKEAAALGISLAVSEECASRLLAGVVLRCTGVEIGRDGKLPAGFSVRTIKRQIRAILSECRTT